MHLRLVKSKSGKNTKRYAQLVQSYRRDDGMPAHKVMANLGELSDQQVENLRMALKASRDGKALVIPNKLQAKEGPIRVQANLQYLDIAIALECFQRWRMSELLDRLLPQESDEVACSSVICALIIQRCVSPGSKLYAQRWFPRTALPELLDVSVEHFNNSRLHRVLDRLDSVDQSLQAALPVRYQQSEGAFATLFMDVTDTYFSGRGCDMAERDRTKEGLRNRHKVGIVLVCNQDGYPLQWQVVAGKRRDPQCLSEMVDAIQDAPWVGEAPVVLDRAMGHKKAVSKLIASGLRFVTATRRTEIESYTESVPYRHFEDLEPQKEGFAPQQKDIETAAKRALEAGLEKVDESLYVLELGVQEKRVTIEFPSLPDTTDKWDPEHLEGGAHYLAKARIYHQQIKNREVKNQAELSHRLGISRMRITQVMNLLKLDLQLQERLLRGDFGMVSEQLLQQCIRLGSKDKQRRLLEDYAKRTLSTQSEGKPKRPIQSGRQEARLRLVAYFNPQMFVEQRLRHSEHLKQVEYFVGDLNRRLRAKTSKRDEQNVRIEVSNKLSKYNLLGVYKVYIESIHLPDSGRQYFQVRLDFNEEEYKRRRRYNGFVLLVAHPELPHSASELVRLYREKDAVEKDFQTIKDVVKLRPVYHHTDPKVRAHVTICMLSLLLQRSIERKLRGTSKVKSAAYCFEQLRQCHLNLIRTNPCSPPSYSLTRPTQEQQAIVRSLGMTKLLDEGQIADRIQPRLSK